MDLVVICSLQWEGSNGSGGVAEMAWSGWTEVGKLATFYYFLDLIGNFVSKFWQWWQYTWVELHPELNLHFGHSGLLGRSCQSFINPRSCPLFFYCTACFFSATTALAVMARSSWGTLVYPWVVLGVLVKLERGWGVPCLSWSWLLSRHACGSTMHGGGMRPITWTNSGLI